MEDIKDPVPMWIMAKLFREKTLTNHPVEEITLGMTLCENAYERMNDSDLKDNLVRLKDAKYIQHVTNQTYIDRVPLARTIGVLEPEYKEVERKYTGYEITLDGALAFRRQIRTPLEKIMTQVDKLATTYADPQKLSRYKQMIEVFKGSTDLGNSAADLIIKSSPAMREFFFWAKAGLKSQGIDIPF